MFLQWVSKCELVPTPADSHVLKKFPEKCQRGMCSMVVGSFGPDGADLGDTLPTAHHIRWAMEVLGHAFALPMDDADVIHGSLRIYEKWLGVDASGKSGKDQRPGCMQKVEQVFIQDLLGQMTLLFEERTPAAGAAANGSATVAASEASVAKQVSLCSKVLDVFDAVAKRRGAMLSPQTWDRMIRLLLGSADAVLHNLRNVLGNQLCGQVVRILFEVYLRSLQYCGPRGELWGLLQKFCRRWIHRTMVIEQWNSVTLALTKSMMRQINDSDPSRDVEIVWADNRLQSTFELESPQIAYAWYRGLRVIGHPSALFDADVYLAAIKGISRLADEFSRVEQVPRVKWEQVLGALNSGAPRDNSMFQAVTNGDEYDRDLRDVITKGDKSTTFVQPRAPPDVNTILRLLGPWLFDACLTRKPRFAAGRSEALRCLGKLLCHYSTGRAKRINWAHGIRSLMALQNALLDDDERITASAIYNWSKIFSLYGNHTLRGAGVMTGPFHNAVERMFRISEQKKTPTSPATRADANRRGVDPFFAQDDHSIGGIPIVLLRRASIEASGSLLTLHSHVPRSLITEAESETVAPAMLDIAGLYSSLPKHTSSNVVSLLMNAIKSEADPTNQQMIMWILTVAIQQEAALWTNGLASSRSSQVPFTILTICSIISKSSKYKPPVMFTAFDCLRHLSLVCDELFFHHTNSVVHLVNACCDFITNSAPILRSSRVPFYLDGLMATAYQCIIEWIVAAPLLLGKQQVIAKIITTVVDGNERIQSFTSKTTAVAVRQAAQKLVNMLMKHHISQTSNSGALAHSSPLTERATLSQFCRYDVSSEDIHKYCRFFSVNKNSILTVIEKPIDTDGGAETIVIMRDSTGRYVWRSKPRYQDGPRPKSLAEFENFQESAEADSDDNTDSSDYELEEGDSDEETRVADPLLSAIRDTQAKTPMMSWKAPAARADASPLKVLPSEGNTGISSMSERKAQSIGRDELRTTQDAVFTHLLTMQSKEDKLAAQSPQVNGARCVRPEPPTKDLALEKWEVSRRMMSELGFLSVRNWGSVFSMEATMENFARDLEAIDKLADRETFEMAVAYVISRPSQGGYDKIHIVDTVDVRSGAIELSSDYELFLAAMGEQIDLKNHTGFAGSVDPELVNGRMLYHSHYSYETCFYVPTMPLEDDDDPDPESMPLLEHTNVLIVWNESQQTYRPGSTLWESAFKLPMPTSGVVIIIDPLGNDLFCVRVCYETSPLFNQRDVITNEEESYLDEGEIFTARVLGPLLDGTVVSGAWLGPLVRQTAINAAMLSRAFHRYQHDIGAISSSPLGAEAKRANMIGTFVEKYMRPKLPGEFYGDLFADVPDN